MRSEDVQSVMDIFRKVPLALCDWCSRSDSEKLKKEPEKREMVDWPECWPDRAIRDLPKLAGEPLDYAREIWERLRDNGTYVITGDRGRGKTVIACWLAHQRRRESRHPGTYLRSHDLFTTIRRTMHPQSKEDEWTALERYRTTGFLVIDEFQERSESEWENRTLVNILDHRHAKILPTVLIANLTSEAFVKSVGPSMADRIAQTGGIVECTWGNLRVPDKK